jgi:chemotaxis protein CheD
VLHTVGISEMRISGNRDDDIITYSLGSCVGVTLYDPVVHIGGLVHCMLPTSSIDPERARQNPMMFTDTGVVALIQTLLNAGCEKRRLVAKIAGAARLLNDAGTFRIGDRNHIVLRKVLWKNSILIAAEDMGGSIARTVTLNIGSGQVNVRAAGRHYELV